MCCNAQRMPLPLPPAYSAGRAAGAELERQQLLGSSATHRPPAVPTPSHPTPVQSVLTGAVPIELERQFLARHNHADLQILKNIRTTVEPRNRCVCVVGGPGCGPGCVCVRWPGYFVGAARWAKHSACRGACQPGPAPTPVRLLRLSRCRPRFLVSVIGLGALPLTPHPNPTHRT